MVANKKEREIIDGVLQKMYDQSVRVPMKDVPIGSLILARFEEELDGETLFDYEIFIAYRRNTKNVRCSLPPSESTAGLYGRDEFALEMTDEVVILQPATAVTSTQAEAT